MAAVARLRRPAAVRAEAVAAVPGEERARVRRERRLPRRQLGGGLSKPGGVPAPGSAAPTWSAKSGAPSIRPRNSASALGRSSWRRPPSSSTPRSDINTERARGSARCASSHSSRRRSAGARSRRRRKRRSRRHGSSIPLGSRAREWLHRLHEPYNAPTNLIHQLGLGKCAASASLTPCASSAVRTPPRRPPRRRSCAPGGTASCRQPERPLGWLRRIAQNEAVRVACRRPDELLTGDPLPASTGRTDDSDAMENRLLFNGILGTLSEADQSRIAPLLRDSTCAKLADHFGLSEATVKVRLHRLRKRLRQRLEAQT